MSTLYLPGVCKIFKNQNRPKIKKHPKNLKYPKSNLSHITIIKKPKCPKIKIVINQNCTKSKLYKIKNVQIIKMQRLSKIKNIQNQNCTKSKLCKNQNCINNQNARILIICKILILHNFDFVQF